MNPFDLAAFHFINHFAGHHPLVDHFMEFFAQYALELYAVLFVIAWFALPKREEKRRHALVVAGLSGILALLINVAIGHVWYRARPFMVLPHGTFTQLIPHAIDSSFPSDHASGSWAFATGSWGRAPKWVQFSFTIIAVIVTVARVYCGVHWITDVLAGLVVGWIASKVMWKASRWIYPVSSMVMGIFGFGAGRAVQARR